MYATIVVQWDIHMKCSGHICSGANVNNVKCMYTKTCGDIVSYIEFVGIYTEIVVSYVHMN